MAVFFRRIITKNKENVQIYFKKAANRKKISAGEVQKKVVEKEEECFGKMRFGGILYTRYVY